MRLDRLVCFAAAVLVGTACCNEPEGDMITISNGDLSIALCKPGTFYQGTRFDWSGVFRSIEYNGNSFVDQWLVPADTMRHDNVCGPSEEFWDAVGYEEAPVGGEFLKVGVGLLRKPSDAPYHCFNLYEIACQGERTVKVGARSVKFTQRIDGQYDYVKTVAITGDDTFEVRHKLTNRRTDSLTIEPYSHNFFTFNSTPTGCSRRVEFPFDVQGDITPGEENRYSLVGDELKILHEFAPGEEIWSNSIRPINGYGYKDGMCRYDFEISDGNLEVSIEGDRPVERIVVWGCRNTLTMEPFVKQTIAPGKTFSWKIKYSLDD